MGMGEMYRAPVPKRGFKPNYPRRPKPLPKRPTTKNLSRRISYLENASEKKHDDAFNENIVVLSGGQVATPMLLAQEGSNITRIGNEVTAVKSILQFQLSNDTAFDGDLCCRFIAFWDTQSNGANCPIAASSSSLTTALLDNTVISPLVYAPFNHNTSKRYKILKDKTFILTQRQSTPTTSSHHFKYVFNLGKAKIKYGSGNLDIAAMAGRQLTFCWIANTNAEGPVLQYAHRWYYTDD